MGRYVVELLLSDRLVPKNALEEFVRLAMPAGTSSDTDREALLNSLVDYWNNQAKNRSPQDGGAMSPGTPLIISRGYDSVVPEDQLAHYLPEEKILINKELFRSKLDSLNLGALDPSKERVLVDQLKRDAIGLSSEDVILYYNLIKVNKLAQRSEVAITRGPAPTPYSNLKAQTEPPLSPEGLFKLTMKSFGIQPDQIVKLNVGKVIDMGALSSVLQESLRRRRIAIPILAHYLGQHNDKYIRAVQDFMALVIQQRGERPEEMAPYQALYVLLGGTDPKLLDSLSLAPPLFAWLSDRIGRVRSIYYAAFVFIHTFVYVLCAQVTEIAVKYQNSDRAQQEKLKKLYWSPERFGLLITNANNSASRRINDYKAETREVQNLFKKFIGTRKDLLSPNDLFDTPVSM